MDRLKVFDSALFCRQIGGIGIIVILDIISLVAGVFFGRMSFLQLCSFLILVNMTNTCLLYHNFIISRGNMRFELNTEKILYYPTTRAQFLLNKYAKTLILLVIQEILMMIGLGLGYLSCLGHMEPSRVLGSLLIVFISILLTSGAANLVMHLMPFGLYLSMLLYYPLTLFAKEMQSFHEGRTVTFMQELIVTICAAGFTVLLWMLLLWVGVKIYEKVN